MYGERGSGREQGRERAHVFLPTLLELLEANDGAHAVHADAEAGADGAHDLRVGRVLEEDVVQVGVVDLCLDRVGEGRQRVEGRVQGEGLRGDAGSRCVSVDAL